MSTRPSEVKVHPVVIITITDAFERRTKNTNRVIGTLLGTQDKGIVEVTCCYLVPHQESLNEVALDLEFDSAMLKKYKQVNDNEHVVGWFSTSFDVLERDVLIHEYYCRGYAQSILLTVDTLLHDNQLNIKAYLGGNVGIPGKKSNIIFSPITVSYACCPSEHIAIDVLQRSRSDPRRCVPLNSDMDQVSSSAVSLQQMIDRLIQYIEQVLTGRIRPDPTIGRRIMDLVNKVPDISSERFEELLNSNMRDLLMVMYISSLAKTQLTLADKTMSYL